MRKYYIQNGRIDALLELNLEIVVSRNKYINFRYEISVLTELKDIGEFPVNKQFINKLKIM